MSRGQPDFGMYAPQAYGASLSDMAELAVRLGSINIFDRRGKVFDLDDCEATLLKWVVATVGNGAAAFDNTSPKSGGQCIKMTSGDGALDGVSMAKAFSLFDAKRLGFEFSFALPSSHVSLTIIIDNYDATSHYKAEIKIDFNAQTLSYLDSSNAFVELATPDPFTAKAFIHYPFKLVADFDTGYYVRLLFLGVEYDLSEYALYTSGASWRPNTEFKLELARKAAPGGNIYLDDFIFTEDEP
ncbi:hypothetical protein LCGC14_1714710 [marine sediment metagenome]|uniref:Uncharacterized protein n=1 Tax=marine sediment metagenome TaxID=412755 RepID=A0A0F9HDX4_9ZZZZ